MAKRTTNENLIFALAVLISFTIADYFFHLISPEYHVPIEYFSNKLLFGFIILFVLFKFIFTDRNLSTNKSLLVAFITSFILHYRYLGYPVLFGQALTYPTSFNVIFIMVHTTLIFIAINYAQKNL